MGNKKISRSITKKLRFLALAKLYRKVPLYDRTTFFEPSNYTTNGVGRC